MRARSELLAEYGRLSRVFADPGLPPGQAVVIKRALEQIGLEIEAADRHARSQGPTHCPTCAHERLVAIPAPGTCPHEAGR